jgi:uncharacterized protein involved in exopolysaccharide biosynthesis
MKALTAKRVQRYASVLVRWLLIGSAVFGLTMTTGYYIVNDALPKVYVARTLMQLPLSDLVTPAGSPSAPVALQPEFVNTMMSPELLLAVVKDLDLEKQWAERLYNTGQEDLPDVDALTRIERLVKVQVKRGTNLVEITAASDVPQEAADIANAVANHYQAMRELKRHDSVLDDVAPGHVRILMPATRPTEPSQPDKGVDFMITLAAACVLSLLAASFVEMILLFVRAGEREES